MVLAPENRDQSWMKDMLHRHDNTLFTDTNINILQKIRAHFLPFFSTVRAMYLCQTVNIHKRRKSCIIFS